MAKLKTKKRSRIVNIRYKGHVSSTRSVLHGSGFTFDPVTKMLPKGCFDKWRSRCMVVTDDLGNGVVRYRVRIPIGNSYGHGSHCTIVYPGDPKPNLKILVDEALGAVCHGDGSTVNVYEAVDREES